MAFRVVAYLASGIHRDPRRLGYDIFVESGPSGFTEEVGPTVGAENDRDIRTLGPNPYEAAQMQSLLKPFSGHCMPLISFHFAAKSKPFASFFHDRGFNTAELRNHVGSR